MVLEVELMVLPETVDRVVNFRQ